MHGWVLAAALALSAPAPPAPAPLGPPEASPPLQVERLAHPAPDADIMAMPAELRMRFRAAVLAGRPTKMQRLERIVHFVFDPDALGMTYQEDATHTVAQSFETRKANCLGFTLMFLALSREAGLDAYPQEVGETLTWREVGGTIYRNNHINTGVNVATERYTLDVAGDLLFALHPPVRVTDSRLVAHYWNNLAIEDYMRGDLPTALQDMATSLALDPGYATHWSNAGVLALRNGDQPGAERAYAKALAIDPRNASALLNVIELSRRTGDHAREEDARTRLARVQQRDPLQQFVQGLDYERLGDYPQAIAHYKRAIALYRSEHRFYEALARAYLHAGEATLASRALARAQSLKADASQASYRSERHQAQRYTR